MSKRESCIPFRQIHWKKYAYLRNRENNIFYDCECGKRYVSFPAIYLHFQRKHKKKLSNRQEPPQCQVRKMMNQLVYFYFVPMKRQKLRNLCEKWTNIYTQRNTQSAIRCLLTNFMNQEKQFINNSYDIGLISQILMNFQRFIIFSLEGKQQENMMNSCQLFMNLPLYFNDFVLMEQRDGKIWRQNYYEVCKILLHLSQWLNKKKISSLIVQLNQEQQRGLTEK